MLSTPVHLKPAVAALPLCPRVSAKALVAVFLGQKEGGDEVPCLAKKFWPSHPHLLSYSSEMGAEWSGAQEHGNSGGGQLLPPPPSLSLGKHSLFNVIL